MTTATETKPKPCEKCLGWTDDHDFHCKLTNVTPNFHHAEIRENGNLVEVWADLPGRDDGSCERIYHTAYAEKAISICRAVNAHDDLVAALKDATDALWQLRAEALKEGKKLDWATPLDMAIGRAGDTIGKISAALAKAERR